MVSNMANFNGTMEDGCIFDVMTADDYVAKVFVPICDVSKSLMMALDLELPNLHEKLFSTLLKQASLVPYAIAHAHARYVNFSVSVFTIMTGNLTSGETVEDTQKLIDAAMPILHDCFPTMT